MSAPKDYVTIALKLPPKLHALWALRAVTHGRSLSTEVLMFMAEEVDYRGPLSKREADAKARLKDIETTTDKAIGLYK